jgi:hypothetical protein
MSEKLLLFPNSKIREANCHDNDLLLSPRKKSILEKDAETRIAEEEKEKGRKREAARSEETGRPEERARRQRVSEMR